MKIIQLIILIYIFLIGFAKAQVNYLESWSKYYETIEYKIIGIWPHNTRYYDLSRLKELRYKWGFNHVLLAEYRGMEYYQMLINSGFDSLNIMRQVKKETYVQNVEDIPETWSYYIDEPADLNENINTWSDITNWIQDKYPNSKIVLSGYKRNNNLKDYVQTLSDNVMFSSYKHWYELFGLWIPGISDQRESWEDMENLFGIKHEFTWVGAHRDLSEYDDLLGKAKNLFLKGVFLFQLWPVEDEVDDNNLEMFAEAATKNGYLTKHYQQIREQYIDGNLTKTQLLGPSYSTDIPTDFDHSSLLFQDYVVTNNRIEDYFAESKIIVGSPYKFIVPPAKKSSLNSNNEIIFKPGFHAELGSEFKAYIGDD